MFNQTRIQKKFGYAIMFLFQFWTVFIAMFDAASYFFIDTTFIIKEWGHLRVMFVIGWPIVFGVIMLLYHDWYKKGIEQ